MNETIKDRISKIIKDKEKEKLIYLEIISILEYFDLGEMNKCDREYVSELLKELSEYTNGIIKKEV